MAQVTHNDKCDLSAADREFIAQRADELFAQDVVEAYIPLGKRDVCLKRESRHDQVFSLHEMIDTLARNENTCTRFNKRVK